MAMTQKQRTALVTPVERHLDPGEQVLDVTMGALHEEHKGKDRARASSVVVTDRRVIFFRKKLGGYDLRALDHVRLAAVDHGQGLVVGELRLTSTTGEVLWVTSMPKEDVERIAGLLRQRLAP
jgi:hypothetical protein